MNTDLITSFKTALTLCVVATLKLNQLLIFLLHYHHYTNIHLTLINSIAEIISNTFNITNECLVNLLLFGSPEYTEIDNSHIINATIKYLLDSERLENILILVILIADLF